MIRNKTVVVVAAGASNDLDLPLGPELQKRIATLLASSGETFAYLNEASIRLFGESNRDRALGVANRARAQERQLLSAASIDNFLDQLKQDEEIVLFFKMTIAFVLARAEMNSKLAGNDAEFRIIEQAKDYFLYDFMNIVIRGHQPENLHLSMENLTFVIFNYDRCVERYLDIWLKFRFGQNFPRDGVLPKFIHVYGSLGDYFDKTIPNPFIRTGAFPFQNPHLELPSYAQKIKVFTEQEDSQTKVDITNAVDEAKALIFLGFGFEEQNMRFFEGGWPDKAVFATLYGESEENQEYLRNALTYRFSATRELVKTIDGKSKKLISDLRHSLSAAVKSL